MRNQLFDSELFLRLQEQGPLVRGSNGGRRECMPAGAEGRPYPGPPKHPSRDRPDDERKAIKRRSNAPRNHGRLGGQGVRRGVPRETQIPGVAAQPFDGDDKQANRCREARPASCGSGRSAWSAGRNRRRKSPPGPGPSPRKCQTASTWCRAPGPSRRGSRGSGPSAVPIAEQPQQQGGADKRKRPKTQWRKRGALSKPRPAASRPLRRVTPTDNEDMRSTGEMQRWYSVEL